MKSTDAVVYRTFFCSCTISGSILKVAWQYCNCTEKYKCCIVSPLTPRSHCLTMKVAKISTDILLYIELHYAQNNCITLWSFQLIICTSRQVLGLFTKTYRAVSLCFYGDYLDKLVT